MAVPAQAFVLLLNSAPLQHVSRYGSHLKVLFKSLYFITWSFHVITKSNRSLLSLIVCCTTFSSHSFPVAASTIAFTLQLERVDVGLGQPLCLGEQQEIYRVNIKMQCVVTHPLHSEFPDLIYFTFLHISW